MVPFINYIQTTPPPSFGQNKHFVKFLSRRRMSILGHKCHPRKLILCGLIHFLGWVGGGARSGFLVPRSDLYFSPWRKSTRHSWIDNKSCEKELSAISGKWIRKCQPQFKRRTIRVAVVLQRVCMFYLTFTISGCFFQDNMLNITTCVTPPTIVLGAVMQFTRLRDSKDPDIVPIP